MGVSAILMHGEDGYLDEGGVDGVSGVIGELDANPAAGVGELLLLDLDEVVERATRADDDAGGRVGLVLLVVQVEMHLRDERLLGELDVDRVRLQAVRLPVRLQAVVPQLLCPKPGLRTGQRPHSV